MQWYYLDSSQKQVEVTEEELTNLFQAGTITKDTLVWSEKLTDWTPLGTALPNVVTSGAAGTTPAAASPAAAPTATTTSATSSGSSGGSMNPYAAPSASLGGAGNASIQSLAGILAAKAGWIKTVAILNIIIGAIYCVLIIYAIFGWVFIWMGVILLKAASLAEEAQSNGNEASLSESLERIGKFFKISGIFFIIGLVLSIVFTVILFATGFYSALEQGGL